MVRTIIAYCTPMRYGGGFNAWSTRLSQSRHLLETSAKWLMLLGFGCLLLAMPSKNTYTVPAEPTAQLQGACNKLLNCNLPGPVCAVRHAGAWRCSTADLAEWTTFCATCCELTTPFFHQLTHPQCLERNRIA